MNEVKTETASFKDLQLSEEMMDALREAGYEYPTPVQAGFIPEALEEKDVLGQARTGTGKTAAFAIPILELLDFESRTGRPQALILVPTRELAVQVKNEVEKLAKGLPVRAAALYGGTPIRKQLEKLKRGVEVVVGTPGRVLDHLSRGSLRLDEVACVVLDEADRMLDVGFRPDIEKILRRCPQERQTLLLSATLPSSVQRLAQKYMQDPLTLNFSENDVSVDTIDQYYFTVDAPRKYDLLVKLLEQEDPRQAIIFCRTKRGTQRTYEKLAKRFKHAGCMHGDMAQKDRERVMEQFRQEKIRFMVATDVMGRGIDVSGISHIINFDIPAFSEDYVHRVGRTGRMGREGVAYTFVTPEEGIELTRIEQKIDRMLTRKEMAGFIATPKPVASSDEPPEPETPEQEEKRRSTQSLGRRGGRKHRRAL